MDLLDAAVLSHLLRGPAASRIPRPDRCAVDQRVHDDPSEQWRRVEAAGPLLQDAVKAARGAAERQLRSAQQAGIAALPFGSPQYPARLAAIADPPPLLWCRGAAAALEGPAVAVVGSRAGSPYALEVAFRLGSGLAAAGVAVVSGLARGVDGAAHRGVLAAGGVTVGVPGCGVDVAYPWEHRDLLEAVAAAGGVIGELPPGEPPRAFHFPRRNRIISGLSLAVVVVEASERSGSLITARCAAEQGRDVMAVPGNVLAGRSRGAHALIRDGARLVESVDDILDEIGPGLACKAAAGQADGDVQDTQADPLLGCMDPGESYDLDELAALSGCESAALTARVVELEIEGRIVRSDTGRFSLAVPGAAPRRT